MKACCPDAGSMVNRASHSTLKLTSPCQILGLEVIISSVNSSGIKIISWSGPPLFLSLQPRFIYLCKQELTRKPGFFSNLFEIQELFSKLPSIQCLFKPQCMRLHVVFPVTFLFTCLTRKHVAV